MGSGLSEVHEGELVKWKHAYVPPPSEIRKEISSQESGKLPSSPMSSPHSSTEKGKGKKTRRGGNNPGLTLSFVISPGDLCGPHQLKSINKFVSCDRCFPRGKLVLYVRFWTVQWALLMPKSPVGLGGQGVVKHGIFSLGLCNRGAQKKPLRFIQK